jgi:hypothetical protein
MSAAVLRSRVEMLNAVVGPVVETVAGGEWRGHSVSGGGKTSRPSKSSDPNRRTFRMGDRATPEEKEAGLLNALGSRMRTVPRSGEAAPDSG